MKKINNRGFAISTMLYGLLIIMVLMMALLMSTLAFTRNNSKKFVNEVVDKLQKREMNITVVNIDEQPLSPEEFNLHIPEEAKGNFYKNEQYKFNIKVKVNNSITPVKINCSPSEVVAYPKIGTTSLSYGTNICPNVSKVSGEENTFEIKNISISTGNNYGDLTVNLMDGLFINEDGEKTKASSIKIGTVNNSNDECNIKLASSSLTSTSATLNLNISQTSKRPFSKYDLEKIAEKLQVGFDLGLSGVLSSTINRNSCIPTINYGPNVIFYTISIPSINGDNSGCNYSIANYLSRPEVVIKLSRDDNICGNSNDIEIATSIYFCNVNDTNCNKRKYNKYN